MRILVSGRPGVGKTTLIKKLSERVRGCGFYTEEVRDKGIRVGFDAVNILTGERLPIARVGYPGPSVGKYGVMLENLEGVIEWLKPCRVVYVDEIGPMELKHPAFAKKVLEVAEKAENFIGTVHRGLAEKWRGKLAAKLYWIDVDNRERVFGEILRLLTSPSL